MVLELHFRSSGHTEVPQAVLTFRQKWSPFQKNVSFPVVDLLVIVHKRDQREGANILSFMSQKWAILVVFRSRGVIFFLGSAHRLTGMEQIAVTALTKWPQNRFELVLNNYWKHVFYS